MAGKREVDQISGVETTGHSWDGIRELNTPLPRWWLWTLYATILFSIGYVIVYPAFPGLTGSSQGVFGWSSRGDIEAELAAVAASRQDKQAKVASMTVDQIIADPELRQFAIAAGASHFKVNCVQCHGSGAQGGVGYPNLNDDSWIWGGKPEQIYTTIAHGVRYAADPETRVPADMPKFGADGLLTPEQINEASEYVLQLSKQTADAALAEKGKVIYTEQCAACHGENGEGNQDAGAPQLNDAVWLYGGTKAEIAAQIHAPRLGVMPAWSARLGDVAAKELTAYVHSLGGGS